MWSVLPSSLSGKKTATPTQFSDQSTLSVKFCQIPRHTTSQCKSYSMQCSLHRGSYDIGMATGARSPIPRGEFPY
jgi:hypothetical protein